MDDRLCCVSLSYLFTAGYGRWIIVMDGSIAQMDKSYRSHS